MAYLIIIVGLLLALLSTTKLVAIINAFRWMHQDGLQYEKLIQAFEEQHPGQIIPEPELYQIYDAVNGRFWPFGLKDYLLRRRSRRSRVMDLLRKMTFTYPYLVLELGAFFVTATTAMAVSCSRNVLSLLVLELCLVIMFLLNIAMITEFLFGNVIMERYTRNVHILDDERFFARFQNRVSNKRLDLLRGIYMIGGLLGGVGLFGISATYFGALLLDAFERNDQSLANLQLMVNHDLSDWIFWGWELAWIIAYFVSTTLSTVGYGDVHPVPVWGYFVAIALHIQQIGLFVFAATVFLGSRS